MSVHLNLERLIGTAVVDREFRAALLASPRQAADGFGLSSEELGVIEAARATTLEELASHVHAWITRTPHPQRKALRRPPLGGYQGFRVAV